MDVVLLHQSVPPDAPPDEADVLVQVAAIEEALVALGHRATRLPVSLDLGSAADRLRAIRPDRVFNLVESFGGMDELAFVAPALLDSLNLPYTGSPTEAIFLTSDKLRAKHRMEEAGLPTPAWFSPQTSVPLLARRQKSSPTPIHAAGEQAVPPTRYILKPVARHASFALDDDSIVEAGDQTDLQNRLRERADHHGCPFFAEQFIDGREFNLSLLAGDDGPEVLPPAEIDFSAFAAGKPRIVGYRAKWEADSFEYQHTPRRQKFGDADRPLVEELTKLAKACWSLFGLRGYARVDFRVDQAGRPWILEINANPCLSPDAGFAAALLRAGIAFREAIQRIMLLPANASIKSSGERGASAP